MSSAGLKPIPQGSSKFNLLLAIVGLIVVLVAVNLGIKKYETHLATAEKVLLQLAPVDPRSLMQGDYMALNYAISEQIMAAIEQQLAPTEDRQPIDELYNLSQDGLVIIKKDPQGVGHFVRLVSPSEEDQLSLAKEELLLAYRLRQGQLNIALDRELLVNTVAIGVYRLGRQTKLVRNNLNLLTANNHQGDLDFALGQGIEGRVAGRLKRFERQLLCHLRTDIALACEHLANCLNHFSQTGTFGHITRRACLQQARRKRVFFTHGHSDNLDIRVAAHHLASSLKTTNARHFDIHQNHIRPQFTSLEQRLFAGLGLTDHLQTFDIGQHSCDPCTHKIVVIDH